VLIVVLAGAVVVGIALTAGHHTDASRTSSGQSRHPATVPASATTSHPAVFARSLVNAAHWEHTSLGYRLRVDPSLYGRNHALDSPPTAFRQALRAAAPTPFDLSPSVRQAMTRQLRCHAEFAATKPRWDLEAWRPDVSYVATEQTLCNP
jgi:hypothetical protein